MTTQTHNQGCKYKSGDRVTWRGQNGMHLGTVRRITRPENSGYVLHLDIGDGIDDFPLLEQEAIPAASPVPEDMERRAREVLEARWTRSAGPGYFPGSRADIPELWRTWWKAMEAFIPEVAAFTLAETEQLRQGLLECTTQRNLAREARENWRVRAEAAEQSGEPPCHVCGSAMKRCWYCASCGASTRPEPAPAGQPSGVGVLERGLGPIPEGQREVAQVEGWVRTSERLPEDDSDVFAAIWWINKDNPAYSSYAIHDCLFYEGGPGSGQKIFADCEGEEFEPEDVEYWIYKKDLAAQLPSPSGTHLHPKQGAAPVERKGEAE